MSLQAVLNTVKTTTGLTDDSKVLSFINLAAQEIWGTIDLPGTLREVRVNVDAARYATLPVDAWAIRASRLVTGVMENELVPIGDVYSSRYQRIQQPWKWRMLYKTPLQNRLANAARVSLTAKKALSARTTITLSGPTAQGTRVFEPLVIDAGQTTVTSQECFQDILGIEKSATTNADIELKDAAGNLLTTIPNNILQPQFWLIQVRADGSQACPECGCYDVLYKPTLPTIDSVNGYWPPDFDQVLTFKAIEHFYLTRDEKLGEAAQYNEKARSLLAQFQMDQSNGQVLRPTSRTPSGFSTKLSSTL